MEPPESRPTKPFKVKVIGCINPHVFWLEAIQNVKDDKPVQSYIIQAGLADVFPTMLFSEDPVYQFKRKSSKRWIHGAKNILAKNIRDAQEIYFLPMQNMTEKHEIIHGIKCIFGELLILNNELQSVTKILSDYGVLYKSSSRFKRYLKSDKEIFNRNDYVDLSIVDEIVMYANEQYNKFIKKRDESSEIRQRVKCHKKEVKEHLTNVGADPKEVTKFMKNLQAVYDMCIALDEEDTTGSVRLMKDRVPKEISEKSSTQHFTTETNKQEAPAKTFLPPAGMLQAMARKESKHNKTKSYKQKQHTKNEVPTLMSSFISSLNIDNKVTQDVVSNFVFKECSVLENSLLSNSSTYSSHADKNNTNDSINLTNTSHEQSKENIYDSTSLTHMSHNQNKENMCDSINITNTSHKQNENSSRLSLRSSHDKSQSELKENSCDSINLTNTSHKRNKEMSRLSLKTSFYKSQSELNENSCDSINPTSTSHKQSEENVCDSINLKNTSHKQSEENMCDSMDNTNTCHKRNENNSRLSLRSSHDKSQSELIENSCDSINPTSTSHKQSEENVCDSINLKNTSYKQSEENMCDSINLKNTSHKQNKEMSRLSLKTSFDKLQSELKEVENESLNCSDSVVSVKSALSTSRLDLLKQSKSLKQDICDDISECGRLSVLSKKSCSSRLSLLKSNSDCEPESTGNTSCNTSTDDYEDFGSNADANSTISVKTRLSITKSLSNHETVTPIASKYNEKTRIEYENNSEPSADDSSAVSVKVNTRSSLKSSLQRRESTTSSVSENEKSFKVYLKVDDCENKLKTDSVSDCESSISSISEKYKKFNKAADNSSTVSTARDDSAILEADESSLTYSDDAENVNGSFSKNRAEKHKREKNSRLLLRNRGKDVVTSSEQTTSSEEHQEIIESADGRKAAQTNSDDDEELIEMDSDPDLIMDETDDVQDVSEYSTLWDLTTKMRYGVDSLGMKSPLMTLRKSISPESKRPAVKKSIQEEVERESEPEIYDSYAKCSFLGDMVEQVTKLKVIIQNKNRESFLPWRDMKTVLFSSVMIKNLKMLDVREPTQLQSSVWPVAFSDRSVLVIGHVRSGRGLSILAPVCNKLPKIMLSDLPDSKGPIMMIVCPDKFAASVAFFTCNILLKDIVTIQGDTFKVFKIDNWMDNKSLFHLLNGGVHVLIITVQCLYQFLNYEISVIDFRRLLYIIYDNLDTLNEQFHDETKRVIDECQKANDNKKQICVYAISRTWCELLGRLARESNNSTLITAALQECLFFSEALLNVAQMTKDRKLQKLNDILDEQNNQFRRIVILCNDDEEIYSVNNSLKNKYLTIVADSVMTIDILNGARTSWRKIDVRSCTVIMITTGVKLQFLDITNAHWLIHYSLPATFTRFDASFWTMSDNYPNYYLKTKDAPLKIDVFITEDDLMKLPKLSQFLVRFNIELPDCIKDIIDKVLKEQDTNKEPYVPLCQKLATFGYCDDTWSCIERHCLLPEDEPADWIPRTGQVKCHVTTVYHASLFSARLLEYVDVNGNTHVIPQNQIHLLIEMSAYYSIEGNRRSHGDVTCGDYCTIKLKGSYKRCQVLRIFQTNHRNDTKINALVNLIDDECYLDVRKCDLLYLPDHLKNIKSTMLKIRLAGIVPSDDNNCWSAAATADVRSLLCKNNELTIRGNIVLGIGNTLWLSNIQISQQLKSLQIDVVKCNLKNHLISNGFAVENDKHLKDLYDLCNVNNFTLPCYEKSKKKWQIRKMRIEPQWAHLNDTFLNVFLSSGNSLNSFFVTQQQFWDLLDTLEKDIQSYVVKMKENFSSAYIDVTAELIVQGYYCAALFEDGMYNRSQVLSIEHDEADKKHFQCFFVDHGETRLVAAEDTYPLTEDFVRRLPFQAIECRMYGTNSSDDDELSQRQIDLLYDFSFIGNSIDLKSLAAKYYTKEKAKFTEGHKYGIVLIDYDSQKSFVDFIIEQDLAHPIVEEIELIAQDEDIIKELFVVKEPQEIVFNDEDNNFIKSTLVEWSDDDSDKEDDDKWDCQFTKDDYLKTLKKEYTPRLEDEKTTKNIKTTGVNFDDDDVILYPSVANKSQFKTPHVLWHQTENYVTMKIMLADIKVYECDIEDNSLYFETAVESVRYKLDLLFPYHINKQKSFHNVKGMYVFMRLFKINETHWNCLTRNVINTKMIVYDPDFITLDDEPVSDEDDKHFKDVLKKRIENDSGDDENESDHECDDIKNLHVLEDDPDPVNRMLLKQMKFVAQKMREAEQMEGTSAGDINIDDILGASKR